MGIRQTWAERSVSELEPAFVKVSFSQVLRTAQDGQNEGDG